MNRDLASFLLSTKDLADFLFSMESWTIKLTRNLIFTSPSMPMRLARCGNGLQAHVYGLPEVISIARQLQEDGDKDLVGFHPY